MRESGKVKKRDINVYSGKGKNRLNETYRECLAGRHKKGANRKMRKCTGIMRKLMIGSESSIESYSQP